MRTLQAGSRRPDAPAIVAFALMLSALAVHLASAGISDMFGQSPLVLAIEKKSLKDTRAALVDGASANSKAADGTPVIVLAVGAGSLEIVRELVEAGARPDDRSKDGTTALALAASNGELEIATYLLDHKADVNLPGSLGETPLIKAVRARNNGVVSLLLARGGDPADTDQAGATATDIARDSAFNDTLEILKKAGTR